MGLHAVGQYGPSARGRTNVSVDLGRARPRDARAGALARRSRIRNDRQQPDEAVPLADGLPEELEVWFVPAVGLLLDDRLPLVEPLPDPVVEPEPVPAADPQG